MKKQVCKDCYYAGFDKCDHIDETEYLKQGENGKKLKESISQLKTKVMESRNVDLHESVIVYALRYAFKRRTGALLQIVEYLKPIAKNLQEQTKKDILREMDNERRRKSDCVDFVWDELEELLTKK